MSVAESDTGVQSVHLGPLTDGDLPALRALVDADPIVNAAVAARLQTARSLLPRRLGGTAVGVHRGHTLAAACFAGGNLIPVGGAAADLTLIAGFVANRPRVATSIVGRDAAVHTLWARLEQQWGRARAIRADQPVLVTESPPGVGEDESVRRVSAEQLDRYVAAGSAMVAEELGVSPWSQQQGAGFERRMAQLIDRGWAFASVDHRGQVLFKAEIAVVTPDTAQIQGVWVRPDLRGRGIGTSGMATVIRAALDLAPTVSLYVNAFNAAACRVYKKVGMEQTATLATVLL